MKNKSIVVISLVLGIIITIFAGIAEYNRQIENGLCEKILRFHVIANSDSPNDQIIKLAVKKGVLNEMDKLLINSLNKDDVKEIIEKNEHIILKTAQDTVKRFDKDYGVTLNVCKMDFSERELLGYTFPKGKYETVNIVIGNGNGKNFWGLIYPDSCLNEATVKITFDDELKKTLTENEYNMLKSKNSNNALPEIRFKLYDLWQDLK